MRYVAPLLFAAALALPATADAGTLLFHDFQNFAQAGWAGEKDKIGTSAYKENVSLRITGGATATQTISTKDITDVTVTVSFAAIGLGAHGGCFADASIDDGANWLRIFRIGRGKDDGVKLYTGSATLPELANRPKVVLRLLNTGDRESNCWADNITVTGNGPAEAFPANPAAAGGPVPPTPASAGTITWDPTSVK